VDGKGYEFLANVNSRSRSAYAIARPSVVCRLSVCLSSVTFVHLTQPVEILSSVSTPFGTLAILGILATPFAFKPPTERFPWDDLRKLFRGCQRMAKVPNGVKISPKI